MFFIFYLIVALKFEILHCAVRNVVILENGTTQHQESVQISEEQQQQHSTHSTTTATVTEVHTLNGQQENKIARNKSNEKVMRSTKNHSLVNGNDASHYHSNTSFDSTNIEKKLGQLNVKDNLVGTTASNSQVTQNTEQISGHNGESGQVRTINLHTSTNGFKQDGNKRIQAKGTADVKQTEAACGSSQTTVTADGSVVTTVKSAKTSSVKYAVEASTIKEEIIR